jgi:hypothetical protein
VKTLLLAGAAIIALSTAAHAADGFKAHCQYNSKSIEIGMLADENNTKAYINAGAGDVFATHARAPGGGSMVWENDTATVWFVGPARGHSSVKLNGRWRPMQCSGFEATEVALETGTDANVPPVEVAAAPPAVLNDNPPPPAGSASSIVVALYDIPHVIDGLYANVAISGTNYHMTLDTGCSDLHISNAVADWLIAHGQATVTGSRRGKQADGTITISRSLTINSISLDGHTITDVPASDGAPDQDEGSMLLGLGVLKKFGKFSIDTVGHQLTLG